MNHTREIEYPKIQQVARRYSKLYQNCSSALVAINLALLVIAAGAEVIKPADTTFAYPKTLLLLLSLVVASLSARLELDKKWYASRSLSETLKSLIWRYATHATPFNTPASTNKELLIERIEIACHESNILVGHTKFKFDKNDIKPIILRKQWIPFKKKYQYIRKNA